MPESKSGLRGNRRHALNAWLAERHMSLDESVFWTEAFKAREAAKFSELDAAYETAKALLAVELKAISVAELSAFFDGIGWTALGTTKAEKVDDYIARA